MIKINVTWHNAGPHTIWGKLAAKLSREPTSEEAAAEVKRILGCLTMGGMMAPAYLILGAIACVLAIPLLVGFIKIITEIGRAMGL